MMTLAEAFATHKNQNPVPSYVFCYVDDAPKSIVTSQIHEYEALYKVIGTKPDVSICRLSTALQLPILVRK